MLQFLRYILLQTRTKQASTLALILIAGLLEGTGILLLIPFLDMAGLPITEPTKGLFGRLTQLFRDTFGIVSLESGLVIYILLACLIAGLHCYKNKRVSEARYQFERDLRTRFFRILLESNYSFLSTQNTAKFSQIISHDILRLSQGAYLLWHIIASSLISGIYLVATALVSSRAFLVFLGIMALVILLIHRMYENPFIHGKKLHAANQKFHEIFMQFVTGMKSIKTSSVENDFLLKIKNSTDEIYRYEMEFSRSQTNMKWFYDSSIVLMIGIGFYIAFILLKIPLASILVSLMVYARLFPLGIDIHHKLDQVRNIIPHFQSIKNFFDSAVADAENLRKSQVPIPFSKGITIQDLTFAYPTRSDTPIFSDLTIQIPFGHLIGISGRSGIGKTTLADILSGTIPTSSGHIQIDDKILSDSDRYQWRSQVCYLTQDVFLFSGTIRENLAWGINQKFEDKALWNALEKAAAADFVFQLPEKLDSRICNNGSNFSGGQRQRLALARIFLKNPSLLILDEFTSYLDLKNQREIERVLKSLKGITTTIIISHNQKLLSIMDHHIILENKENECQDTRPSA